MSKPRTKQYCLIPEMVPRDLWGRSAYRMLGGRTVWKNRIRPDALVQSKGRCGVCTAKAERLICHDKWLYDDKKAIATLVGFEMHCDLCDMVTHIGRAMQVQDQRIVVMAAVGHLSKVNKCDEVVALDILSTARDLWEKRSRKAWKISVNPKLLENYPELKGLPEYEAPVSF